MKKVSLIALAACAFYASHASAQTMPFYPSPATGQNAMAQTTPGAIAYTDGSLYIDAATSQNLGVALCELRTRRRADAWVALGWGAVTYEKMVTMDADTDADWRRQGKVHIPCLDKPFPTVRAPVRPTL